MAINLELTWKQFDELRLLCDSVSHAKNMGADEGELKNTIVDGEWNIDKVELTIDIES